MENSKKNQGILDQVIGIREAAVYSGYSERHMRHLLEEGSITGKKVGHDWITTRDYIDQYIRIEHHPGRKSKAEFDSYK